jgi:uncharacterized protein (DUF1684 family)
MIRGPISRSARSVFRRLPIAVAVLFAVVVAVSNPRHGGAQTASVTMSEAAQGLSGLAAWRSQREMEISAPDGWLTLAGLEWLKSGVNSIGSAADNQIHLRTGAPDHLGLLTVVHNATGQVVQLLSPTGGFPAGLTTDGKPAREGSLDVDGPNPTEIAWQGISLTVLKRGDRFVLRIKDSASPNRAGFHGLKWFAPDARYLVTARWVPFKPPQVLEIPTVIGTSLKLPAPGIAMFVLNGMVVHLEPVIEEPAKKTLFFILRDSTSESTTYPGGRFLHTGLPDHGLDKPGSLILDFNRLENPPCAYTVYATCPLPPDMNKLPIAVEAGERLYER